MTTSRLIDIFKAYVKADQYDFEYFDEIDKELDNVLDDFCYQRFDDLASVD